MNALIRLLLASVLLGYSGAIAAADPLAGIVLDDLTGRTWALDELHDAPVLLIIADRDAATQAQEWGTRLASQTTTLAPWRAAGKVVCLSIADLRRVPEYARDAAHERVRAQEAERRSGTEPASRSPLLLDWSGRLAGHFGATRGAVTVVALAQDRRLLERAAGAPTAESVARMLVAITGAATPEPPSR